MEHNSQIKNHNKVKLGRLIKSHQTNILHTSAQSYHVQFKSYWQHKVKQEFESLVHSKQTSDSVYLGINDVFLLTLNDAGDLKTTK